MTIIYNIAVWLSCGLNVLTGGSPYCSFSARQYRRDMGGKANLVWLIDGIFSALFNEPAHCWMHYQKLLNRYNHSLGMAAGTITYLPDAKEDLLD